MRRTAVKICGLTRAEDAALAAELGADAVGVVFAKSPRRLYPDRAAAVLRAAGDGVARVGVFAGEPLAFVLRCIGRCRLDRVQLAGEYGEADVARIPVPVIRVVAVAAGNRPALDRGTGAILLDAPPRGEQMGGTGRTFEWDVAARFDLPRERLIVAGGLRAENVGEAIARLAPAAVDVSSGVELCTGVKDRARMESFFAAVAAADALLADPALTRSGRAPVFRRQRSVFGRHE